MELQETIVTLRTSKKLLETIVEKNNTGTVYIKDVSHIFLQYSNIRTQLIDKNTIFKDLVRISNPPEIDKDKIGSLIHIQHIESLILHITYCLDLIAGMSSIPSAEITREGVFFGGQSFDALYKVREIFSQAKQSIVIIDGYINAELLQLMSAKASEVTVSILTDRISEDLIPFISRFNEQYGGLTIRTSSAFHDRFVIIDDNDFYHFGTSIKDVGKRYFMFSRIEEPFIFKNIRNEFTKRWETAKQVANA